ncbi:MAG: glycosyltransferase, partial [archaeon]
MRTTLNLGRLCNNDCKFCKYLDNLDKSKPLNEVREELLAVKGAELIIRGGEPAIRDDFFEIIRLAKKSFKSVILESNGRIFCYRDFCEQAIQSGIDKFAIKLNSDNPLVHDRITGFKGSFIQTLQGIRNLKKLHQDVRIIVILCRDNYQHIADIVKFAKALDIDEIQVIFPESASEEYRKLEKVVPTIDEAVGFIDDAKALIDKYGMKNIPGNTPFTMCHYRSRRVKKGNIVSPAGHVLRYDSARSTSQPYATVIIPTFNRSNILKNTVLSLYKQTYRNFEVIVVDDGSRDDTESMVRSLKPPFRLRYFIQNDLGYGPGRARNLGAKYAEGKLLIYLDTDVMSDPVNIEEHVKAHKKERDILVIGRRLDLHKSPEIDAAINEENILNNFDAIRRLPMKSDMREDFFYWSGDRINEFKAPWTMLYSNNISIKRQHYLNCGGIDPSFAFWSVEDQELGYRLGFLKYKLNRSAIGYHQHHPLV